MDEEHVVLVDASDNAIGRAPKLEAHRQGLLHRAVSVFVFRPSGELLIQRRALDKYHSGGRWANTCCGHPRPGESPEEAATRRLHEEMGLACPLEHAFSFVYRAALQGGLVEHEFDHVFVGTTTEEPRPDAREVNEWRAISPVELTRELADDPDTFAAWFAPAWQGVSSRGK